MTIINEFSHSYSDAFLTTLLDTIDVYIKETEESSLNKDQQEKLLDYIISAVAAVAEMSEEEVREILIQYCPEQIKEELVTV